MVKRLLVLCVVAMIFIASCAQSKQIRKKGVGIVKDSSVIFLDDFDMAEKTNRLGGESGTWNKDPDDLTQGCVMSFDGKTRCGDGGFSLKLDYDVDSPNPAYCGYWSRLQNINLSRYRYLNFYVKGDDIEGYTTKFTIELKSDKQSSRYIVDGLDNNWQIIKIPLSKFSDIKNWKSIEELVITFDDAGVTNKEGGIFIDDLYFSRK